jgi:uncharacterized protein (DUF2164 family)
MSREIALSQFLEQTGSMIQTTVDMMVEEKLKEAKLSDEEFLEYVSGLAVGYAFHNQGKYNPNGTDFRRWLESEESKTWKTG